MCSPKNVRVRSYRLNRLHLPIRSPFLLRLFLIACVLSCPYSCCLCYWRNELFFPLSLTLYTSVIWAHFTRSPHSLSFDKSIWCDPHKLCQHVSCSWQGRVIWKTYSSSDKKDLCPLSFSLEINNLSYYLPIEVLFLTSFSFSLGTRVEDWTLGSYACYISTVPWNCRPIFSFKFNFWENFAKFSRLALTLPFSCLSVFSSRDKKALTIRRMIFLLLSIIFFYLNILPYSPDSQTWITVIGSLPIISTYSSLKILVSLDFIALTVNSTQGYWEYRVVCSACFTNLWFLLNAWK